MVGYIAHNPILNTRSHSVHHQVCPTARIYATFIFSCGRGYFQYCNDLSSLANDR